MKPVNDYVSEMVSAVRGAHQYFPMERAARVEANKRLGREFGYGLASGDTDWRRVAQATYGQMIVANSFDSVGVAIDMKDWSAAIEAGVNLYLNSGHPRTRNQ